MLGMLALTNSWKLISPVKHEMLMKQDYLLCPKSGQVVPIKSVYCITGDKKDQIKTLFAISASGEYIPPMHTFPGERFKSNPTLKCVDRAYFGRSPNGWSCFMGGLLITLLEG